LLELNHSNLETVCITWRKDLRRIWDLPYHTHSNILPIRCSCLPMYDEIYKRTANFIDQCLNSDCALVVLLIIVDILSVCNLLSAEMRTSVVTGTMYSIFKKSIVSGFDTGITV